MKLNNDHQQKEWSRAEEEKQKDEIKYRMKRQEWKEKGKLKNKYRGGTSDATFRRHSFYNFIVIIINFLSLFKLFYHYL